MTSEPALVVRDVHYTYPDGTPALRGVDLRLDPGERVALLGPNGAGKTTLMLHLNGLLRAGAGSVTVAGRLLDDTTVRAIRRDVGMVFQDPDDQLFMPTVAEDVAFGPANAGLAGAQLQQRVDAALRDVGMTGFEQRPPHHLSQGQRRRVSIATVLSMDPRLLVLDEPSSNLDPRSRREVAEILLRLERTTLMVTHDLPYAAQLCPRSVILSDGVVVADGPTFELLTDDALLAEHRLELPYGFDLSRATPAR